MSRKFVTIVANMVISHMIVRNLQSSTRNKKIMTINTSNQRKVMRRRTTRKEGSFTRKKKVKAFLGEWITDGEFSNDDSSDEESNKKIVGIAMHNDEDDGDEAPLPLPPMCFMA